MAILNKIKEINHKGIFATTEYNIMQVSGCSSQVNSAGGLEIYYNNSIYDPTSFSKKAYPITNELLYFIDPTGFFKNYLLFNFNPSLSTSKKINDNNFLVYSGFDCYSGATHHRLNFLTYIDRSNDMNYNDYLYSGSTHNNLLTNKINHKVLCDTELTLRSFNNEYYVEYGSSATVVSKLDKQHLEIYKNGNKELECYITLDYSSYNNPNLLPTAEYPFGLPNINGNDIKITGYYYDGSWHTTSQDSTIIFNDCNLSFDLYVDQSVCDCTCIDRDTGEDVDCDDDNGGCEGSPYAETECWNTRTNRKCNFEDDDPADFICRDIHTHDPCVSDNVDDTSCVWDSGAGVFVGNVSGDLCHSPNRDWVACTSHIIQVPITKTIENIDNLRTYFSYLDNVKTNTYNLDVVCKTKYDAINVAWENKLGGVDYHLFQYENKKYIDSKKTTYDFSKNYFNGSEYVKKDYYKETLVLSNQTKITIEANSGWLNQEEIDNMEDLFESTEVYIKYKDEWRYVINATKKAVIYNKKNKGLKNYKIKFELSEKINR